MSWFDAAGFANLAKSALKEAQKQIDKALDIKDEEQKTEDRRTGDTSDFFASWGLKSGEDVANTRDKGKPSDQEATNCTWGSFTGSFFESPKFHERGNGSGRISHSKSLENTSVESRQKPQLLSSSSVPDDYRDERPPRWRDDEVAGEQQTEKKLLETVVDSVCCENIIDASKSDDASKRTDSSDGIAAGTAEFDETERTCDTSEEQRCSGEDEDEKPKAECEKTTTAVRDLEESATALGSTSNRASVASLENDKKSAESVEILGSRSNTDCSTTPESDGNSLSNSGMGAKLTSESVEILPDSLLTSPSSVEILGDWKSDSSPYLSPIDPRHSELGSVVDRAASVTPCWEHVDVTQVATRATSSSSDISPYESPMEEAETPQGSSCTCSTASTPSTGTYNPATGSQAASKPLSSATSSRTIPKSSAKTVEMIPDADEPDEASFADDSYASASESTAMTILETFQQIEQAKCNNTASGLSVGKLPHDSTTDGKETSKADSRSTSSLDPLKEKHNLHLPIEAITRQPIRNSEYFDGTARKSETERKSFDQLINATIEPAEPERYTSDSLKSLEAAAAAADQHFFISTDSSCEGTLIESGSEDTATGFNRESECKILAVPLTASSYVKTMLADAMIEKGGEIVEAEGQQQQQQQQQQEPVTEVPRENSPISSESRSDLVKIGSDQTSGHTSGDELETTTSSDIEIISSPNGDSSSTQSRQSLAKLQSTKGGDLLTKTLKSRGHSRELSEISVGSDEANLEIEKLLKRIEEMTEIVEARESKLIDVGRMNMELHEQNTHLKRQLENFEKHAEQSQNLNQITDEYTQRLSALERKFQQAIRDRDSLRKNLEELKVEAATRLSSQEMFSLCAEKDEIIKELREEGEKLSKQQLQHSNIIKRLRAKEKENDASIKSQKEQIEEQTLELERLKRSLHAKEEVERTQIEAVHTLTAKTKKQEKDILSLQEKFDNALLKMDAYKKSFDAAKMDLTETKKVLATTEAELKDATNNAGESCQLLAQVEDLKMKLRKSDETHVIKEEYLTQENNELAKRLYVAEARNEELSVSVSMATKPLLRQLEQLQASLAHKTNSFMKQEKALTEQQNELQTKIENLLEVDRYLREENLTFKSTVSRLESKLAAKEAERSQLQDSYDKTVVENEKLVEENARHRQTIESLEKSHSSEVTDLRREIVALENKLAVEKAATDAERRKNHAMSEQRRPSEDNDDDDDDERLSPAANVDPHSTKNSILDSISPLCSSSQESSHSQRYPMLYDSIRAGSSSSTSILENLQAQLKQKDGEIQQLHWELSLRNVERDALNTELSTLTLNIEELNNKVEDVTALEKSLCQVQAQYDTLLEMYGEILEENQELRLDLHDVKNMYKTQIDDLLKRNT